MRITVELVQKSPQYMNPLQERELNLRGLKIPLIENLGATLVSPRQDQFDCIDLTNNELTLLEETAPLRRLSTLLLSHNQVSRISPSFSKNLPMMENLVLNYNRVRPRQISSLREIDHLAAFQYLKRLSLVGNLVTKLPDYRLYVIHTLPHLMFLDFQRICLAVTPM
jgi:U2 small nuclear ribonucleoprotein A'